MALILPLVCGERIEQVPEQYLVILQRRHKYRCGQCYGDFQTAPAPPRIAPGSSYSDEMKVDVAMTKYCDLIPIERYAAIAARAGLKDLPPQSLIESTHQLASYVKAAYEKLKAEITAARVLHADETPHRMLEGDKLVFVAGLTLFLNHGELPIDNNPQERLLRNPVIGRKTWYGTHSKQGAETAAILFSLVESCKLNQVNPRVYFKQLVEDLHAGKAPYTPTEFRILYPVKTG